MNDQLKRGKKLFDTRMVPVGTFTANVYVLWHQSEIDDLIAHIRTLIAEEHLDAEAIKQLKSTHPHQEAMVAIDGPSPTLFIMWVPAVYRFIHGDTGNLFTCQIGRLAALVAMDVSLISGYDPTTGLVTYGYLVSDIMYRVNKIVEDHLNGLLVYASYTASDIDQQFDTHLLDQTRELNKTELSSLVRDYQQQKDHGRVYFHDGQWYSTTYY